MVNSVKVAAIFLGGVAVGGAGVYWAVVGPTKQKYEAILEAEIADVKSHFRHIREKDNHDSPESWLKTRKVETEEKPAAEEVYVEKTSMYQIETERSTPTTNHSDLQERSIFDYNDLGKTEEKEVKDSEAIRVISYEEFDEEHDDYTKATVTYYQADDTVADEMDEVIENVVATLGSEGLSSFGKLDPSNPDTCYIRNHALRTDYEVLLEERSYQEVVVGG